MAFLQGSGGGGGFSNNHPAYQMVQVLEQDQWGNPTLWLAIDNRIYGYDQNNQIVDYTDWYMQQTQQTGFGGTQFVGGFGTTSSMGAAGGFGYNNTGFGATTSPSPRSFRKSYTTTGTTNTGGFGYNEPTRTTTPGPTGSFTNNRPVTNPTTTTTTNATTSFNRQRKETVVEELEPKSGSEMLPLIDEEREMIEVAYDYNNNFFELIVKPK